MLWGGQTKSAGVGGGNAGEVGREGAQPMEGLGYPDSAEPFGEYTCCSGCAGFRVKCVNGGRVMGVWRVEGGSP